MRLGLGFRAAAITMLLLLLSAPIAAAYAQAVDYDDSGKEFRRLRIRAEILQRILERAAGSANISESLRDEIEALVSMNLSALSEEDLRGFIAEAEALLREVKDSLRGNATLSQERVALRLLERVRERLNRTLARLNLTAEEAEQVRERIREWLRERVGEGNLTIRDVAHLMKRIREMIRHRWATRFSEEAMNFTEGAARRGALFGLMNALNASSKVLEVLENVKARLLEVNASPAAIAAIEHAMERIASAREVLRRLIERVAEAHPRGNATREEVKERLETVIKERAEELSETVEEYLGRLRDLGEKAAELNLTDLAEEIGEEIGRLEELKGRLAEGNLSLGDLASAAASTKGLIKRAENLIEKAEKRIGERGPPITPPGHGPERESWVPPGHEHGGKKPGGPPAVPPGRGG